MEDASRPNASPPPDEEADAADTLSVGGTEVKLGNLAGLLGYYLRRAEVFAFQNFAAHLGPQAIDDGVSPGQLGVLLLVEANPGMNQTRIGKAIGIDRSTLVSMIDALEKRALIRREPSPTDRRSHALYLTDKGADNGKAFLKKIRPSLSAHENEIARNLTAEEQVLLMDLLRRIATP